MVDSSCESVDRGGGPERDGKPRILGKLKIKAIAAKGLSVRIYCPAACTVTAELRVNKATARKLGLGRSRVLARGKKTLRSAGEATVKLKVVTKALKRFRRLRSAKVTLKTRTKMGGTDHLHEPRAQAQALSHGRSGGV